MNKKSIIPNIGMIILEKSSIKNEFKTHSGVNIPSEFCLAKVLNVNSIKGGVNINPGDSVCINKNFLKEIPVEDNLQYIGRISNIEYIIPKNDTEKDTFH